MIKAEASAKAPSREIVGRLLLVDDDDAILRATARILGAAGHQVTTSTNGKHALELLQQGGAFDAIVSDISMPELDGIELLRNVRQRDLDVPVILMTGAPEVATAIQAVAHGALQYLVKPVEAAHLRAVVEQAVRLHALARLKREALAVVGAGGLGVGGRLGLDASFDRALSTLWMAYQPIVRAADGSLFGYEALLRSEEKALPHPGAILDAAERLGRLSELGRKIRVAAAAPMTTTPAALFVNLHARDLADEELFSRDSALSAIASQVILEITERASLDGIADARGKIAKLRKMGFRIAIDDLGAGYAGLTSFAALEPELVKLDMSLVRDVDQNPTKQKLIGSIARLCKDLGMTVVAEGIETVAERNMVIELGCDLLQGYLLAKPGKPFPTFVW